MSKKANIAIFVPHSGCPNQCSFCNQHSISGSVKPPTPQEVADICSKAVASTAQRFESVEIAFFGGSFTAIEHDLMISLLKAAQPFIGKGMADGIRISTRPDAITPEILKTLKEYNVTAIELGAQSMDDRVLKMNRRGHTSADIILSAGLIKSYGFSLGLQMMVGLYGDCHQGAVATAYKLADLEPETIRIYPVVVLGDTQLADLYRRGIYTPPDLDEGIEVCSELLRIFNTRGIKVIRMGLHAGEGVEGAMLAGCYHPSLRELVEGRIMYEDISKSIKEKGLPAGEVTVCTSPKSLSKLTGHGGKWLKMLEQQGYRVRVKTSSDLTGLEIRITSGGLQCGSGE